MWTRTSRFLRPPINARGVLHDKSPGDRPLPFPASPRRDVIRRHLRRGQRDGSATTPDDLRRIRRRVLNPGLAQVLRPRRRRTRRPVGPDERPRRMAADLGAVLRPAPARTVRPQGHPVRGFVGVAPNRTVVSALDTALTTHKVSMTWLGSSPTADRRRWTIIDPGGARPCPGVRIPG